MDVFVFDWILFALNYNNLEESVVATTSHKDQ